MSLNFEVFVLKKETYILKDKSKLKLFEQNIEYKIFNFLNSEFYNITVRYN